MTNCTGVEKSKFIGQELLVVQFLRREEMSDIRSGQSASCRPYFSLSDPIEDGG